MPDTQIPFFFFFSFSPIPFIIFALLVLLPPIDGRNSDPGSHCRLFFPLPTWYGPCLGIFVARIIQHFLPSPPTRVELCPYRRYHGLLTDNLVGLGFVWSVSYIKPIPTHEKRFAVAKKVAQMPLLTWWIYRGLGWPWIGEFVGFIIIFTSVYVFEPNRVW